MGNGENKDNMEAFKILTSATPTYTFSVMSQDVVFGSMKDAAVLHYLTTNVKKKRSNLKKKSVT